MNLAVQSSRSDELHPPSVWEKIVLFSFESSAHNMNILNKFTILDLILIPHYFVVILCIIVFLPGFGGFEFEHFVYPVFLAVAWCARPGHRCVYFAPPASTEIRNGLPLVFIQTQNRAFSSRPKTIAVVWTIKVVYFPV